MLKYLMVFLLGFGNFNGNCQTLDNHASAGVLSQMDTIYYPFYDGVQMIEIDHIGFKDKQLRVVNTISYPKTFAEPILNLNEYFFRNKDGKIIKAFNTNQSLQSLTDHFENQVITQPDVVSHKNRLARNEHSNQFKNHYKIVSYVSRARNSNIIYDYKYVPQTYGLIDSLGNVKIPPDYISISPLNGNILASKNQKWGVMDYEQNEIVPFEFDSQDYYSNPEKNNQILFTKGNYYYKNIRTKIISGVYDLKSNKFKRLNNYHSLTKVPNNPLLAVTRYGKLGFLNSDYDEIIAPVYELSDYDGTHAGLFRVVKNGKFGFIDKNAKEIIAPQFEYAEPFIQDSVALVLKNGKFKCINPKGKKGSRCDLKPDWEIVSKMIQPEFQFIRIGKTDYQALYNSTQNKFVLPFQRGAVHPIDINNREQPNYWIYTCEETNLKGLINLKENKKSDCLYQSVRAVFNGFSIVRLADKEGVLDPDFK